jgi:hypothetical protein
MALPVNSKATTDNLAINQGSTFTRIYQVTDSAGNVLDLTGVTAAAKIRDLFTGGSLVQVLTCVVVTGVNSTVTISLTSAQTAALNVPAATPADVRAANIGAWDLELTDGTSTYRFAEGTVALSREDTY